MGISYMLRDSGCFLLFFITRCLPSASVPLEHLSPALSLPSLPKQPPPHPETLKPHLPNPSLPLRWSPQRIPPPPTPEATSPTSTPPEKSCSSLNRPASHPPASAGSWPLAQRFWEQRAWSWMGDSGISGRSGGWSCL